MVRTCGLVASPWISDHVVFRSLIALNLFQPKRCDRWEQRKKKHMVNHNRNMMTDAWDSYVYISTAGGHLDFLSLCLSLFSFFLFFHFVLAVGSHRHAMCIIVRTCMTLNEMKEKTRCFVKTVRYNITPECVCVLLEDQKWKEKKKIFFRVPILQRIVWTVINGYSIIYEWLFGRDTTQ